MTKLKKLLLITMVLCLLVTIMPVKASAATKYPVRYVSASMLNARSGAGMSYKVKRVLKMNTKVLVLKTNKTGSWTKIVVKADKERPRTRYWVATKYLSKKKVSTPTDSGSSNSGNATSSGSPLLYTPAQFRQLGRIRWNGKQWTYYSERVLPGGGLNIPGRHHDSNGYVVDSQGRLTLASRDYAKGTVLNTPFGKVGVVRDYCPTSGVVDVYVSW